MRQPTFFAHAWPRFDHQVYWSGLRFSRRNTSTKPSSSNTRVSQARSSGRKPEFFWLRAPVLEVDLLVRDVPVAAQDDLAASLAQLLQVQEETLEEAELRRLAVRPGRARRHVDARSPTACRSAPRRSGLRRRTRGCRSRAAPRRASCGCTARRRCSPSSRRTRGRTGSAFRPCSFASRSISWHLISCRQTTSARCAASQRNKPLLCGRADAVDVERDDAHGGAPFYRLLDGVQVRGMRTRRRARRPLGRRVQELSTSSISRRRNSRPSSPPLSTSHQVAR